MSRAKAKRKLDEAALRREDFAGGVPIVLGDGQAWTFPRPLLTFFPTIDERGRPRFGYEACRASLDADYDELVDEYLAAEDGLDVLNALLALAFDLLARNYRVDGHEAQVLFAKVIGGDEANEAMWASIRDVALGRAPKPTAAGSDAS